VEYYSDIGTTGWNLDRGNANIFHIFILPNGFQWFQLHRIILLCLSLLLIWDIIIHIDMY